jgi:type IV secretory pathway TrbF-like protein
MSMGSSDVSTHGAPALDPALAEEIAAISKAYEELQRRDGTAESRAWWWKIMAFVLAGGLILSTAWDHLDKRQVPQPFVQTVQVTEDHRVVQMGVPQSVLAYEPEDGQWFKMLAQWVQYVRWRGPDPTLARVQWAWAYLHTCGAATKLLSDYEAREQPFEPQGKTVSVKLLGWNKTLVPLSYHIIWEETILKQGSSRNRRRSTPSSR